MSTFIFWFIVALFPAILSATEVERTGHIHLNHVHGKAIFLVNATITQFFVPGMPVRLNCSNGGTPLSTCRWAWKPCAEDKRYVLHVNESIKQEIFPVGTANQNNSKYSYVGAGLNKGDCSILISNVSDLHHAQWECSMKDLHNQNAWISRTNLTRLASNPYFDNTDFSHGVYYNESFPGYTDISCCMDANDPKLRVTIEMEWEKAKLSQRHTTSNYSVNGTRYCRRNRFVLLPQDNGKVLVCTSQFTFQSQEFKLQERVKVNITYEPILSSGNFSQTTTSNSSVLISVPFLANPPPNVTWYLKNDPTNGASFEIRKDHVKYRTALHHMQDDNFTATLEVLKFEKEDYRKEFELRLFTAHGSKHLLIKLTSPDLDTEPKPDYRHVLGNYHDSRFSDSVHNTASVHCVCHHQTADESSWKVLSNPSDIFKSRCQLANKLNELR